MVHFQHPDTDLGPVTEFTLYAGSRVQSTLKVAKITRFACYGLTEVSWLLYIMYCTLCEHFARLLYPKAQTVSAELAGSNLLAHTRCLIDILMLRMPVILKRHWVTISMSPCHVMQVMRHSSVIHFAAAEAIIIEIGTFWQNSVLNTP